MTEARRESPVKPRPLARTAPRFHLELEPAHSEVLLPGLERKSLYSGQASFEIVVLTQARLSRAPGNLSAFALSFNISGICG